MKKQVAFIILFISFISNAQQKKIIFNYDNAGNQIKREYCPTCSAKNAGEIVKNTEDLKEEDLKKFFPNDDISYYPNPVKDQLYIKWDINVRKVSEISLYDISGRTLKTYDGLRNKDNFTIQFNLLPQNLYSIVLIYDNGERKSIKILKQ